MSLRMDNLWLSLSVETKSNYIEPTDTFLNRLKSLSMTLKHVKKHVKITCVPASFDV